MEEAHQADAGGPECLTRSALRIAGAILVNRFAKSGSSLESALDVQLPTNVDDPHDKQHRADRNINDEGWRPNMTSQEFAGLAEALVRVLEKCLSNAGSPEGVFQRLVMTEMMWDDKSTIIAALRLAAQQNGVREAAREVVTAVEATEDHTQWFTPLAKLIQAVRLEQGPPRTEP